MQSSKAAEIPEELFEYILRHVCDPNKKVPLERYAKPYISACAAVCRYWARLARRELFRCVTLRTLDDVNRFRGILEVPTLPSLEPVAEMVVIIIATLNYTDAPWLHLVSRLILAKLETEYTFSVNALPSKGRTWRTLHPSLPRTPPGSIVPVMELDITGVHFPNGHALARLLSSLPTLRYLNADDISFGTNTQPTPKDLFVPPFGLELYHIATNHHALCLAFLPRLLANRASDAEAPPAKIHAGRTAKYILNDDDLAALCDLFGLFKAGPNFRIAHLYNAPLPRVPDMDILNLSTHEKNSVKDWGRHMAPDIRVYLSPGMNTRTLSRSNTAQAPAQSIQLYVHTVYIDLTMKIANSARELCTESLWTRFAETALKFVHLQWVEIWREWDSHEDDISESLGITDAAFNPLMEARKFRSRFVDDLWPTVVVADTATPTFIESSSSDEESSSEA